MTKSIVILWWCERNEITVAKKFNRIAEQHPDRVAFHTESGPWNFQKVHTILK